MGIIEGEERRAFMVETAPLGGFVVSEKQTYGPSYEPVILAACSTLEEAFSVIRGKVGPEPDVATAAATAAADRDLGYLERLIEAGENLTDSTFSFEDKGKAERATAARYEWRQAVALARLEGRKARPEPKKINGDEVSTVRILIRAGDRIATHLSGAEIADFGKHKQSLDDLADWRRLSVMVYELLKR